MSRPQYCTPPEWAGEADRLPYIKPKRARKPKQAAPIESDSISDEWQRKGWLVALVWMLFALLVVLDNPGRAMHFGVLTLMAAFVWPRPVIQAALAFAAIISLFKILT